MEAVFPERPRAVTVIGWIWLVVAALRLIDGVLVLLVWHIGGVEHLIPLVPLPSDVPVRTIGLEVLLRHATIVLAAQILIAAVVVYTAIALLRLAPWARRAFELFSWLGILIMLGVAGLLFVGTADLPVATPAEARQVRLFGGLAAAFIAAIGIGFFGGTMVLLRRPGVRRAFEPRPA